MTRVIWDRWENPSKHVSDKFGITREQLGDAIRELKTAGNLSPAEGVIIYDNGTVTDESGYVLGDISTRCDNNVRAFVTLRFAGDALDPDEISRVVKEQPTKAYRKGQTYRSGPHGPDVTGRTGVWYFSTRRKIPSKDLVDHLNALDRLIAPFGDQYNRLKELRDIMQRRNLQAHVTFFWRGPPGTEHPSVPSVAIAALQRLPADIEPDFATEDC